MRWGFKRSSSVLFFNSLNSMLTSFIFEVPRGTPWDGSARFKAQMNAKRDIIRGEAQYEDLVLDSNKPGRLDQRLFVRDRLKRLHDSRGSYEIPFAKRRTVDGVSRPMSLQEYAEQGYDTV